MTSPTHAVPFRDVLTDELEEVAASRRRRDVSAAVEPLEHHPYRGANRSDLLGLALSGGGIRSATFGLGVLQALARRKLLRRVDYLSTVSGGGYIGSWLTAWLERDGDAGRVEQALAGQGGTIETPEHRAITFLRELSNYLTPRRGFLGLDAWTLGITYVRNATLHLLVLALALTTLLLGTRMLGALFDVLSARIAAGDDAVLVATVLAVLATSVTAITLLFRGLSHVVLPGRSAHRPTRLDPNRWEHRLIAPLLVLEAWVLAVALVGIGAELEDPARMSFMLGGGYAALWLLGWLALDAGAEWRRIRASLGTPGGPRRASLLSPFGATTPAFVAGVFGAFALWGLGRAFGDIARSPWWWSPAAWGPALVVTAFGATAFLQIGIAGRSLSDEAREWLSRLGAGVARIALLLTLVLSVAVLGPELLRELGRIDWALTAGWLLTTGTGVLVGRAGPVGGPRTRRTLSAVARLAPFVFILGFLLVLAATGNALLTRFGVMTTHTPPAAVLGNPVTWLLLAGLGAATLVLSWRIGINRFSMHALYRDRLVRCYLGASNDARAAHPFTGFDPEDDAIDLADLAPTASAFPGPYPIVNTTLNLVAGRRLAWQERKAASFTFTPRYCGYRPHVEPGHPAPPRLSDYGFRPTRTYAGGVSLGTAIAVSGAAVSPNMGYHSSPSLTFLMTMFNVRLGSWTGNPRHEATWRRDEPWVGLFALASELLGDTHDESRFVYLSDGGHFENLGLYELVRRRCRFIIACDAEQDPFLEFPGLGTAVERCRADFGVPIEIDTAPLRPAPGSRHGSWHGAVGRIRYSAVDPEALDGTLLYLKASLTGNEPRDVETYAARNPDFPHESTADQWFGESQFESYRALGEHAADEVLGAVRPFDAGDSLESYFVELQKRWYPPSRSAAARSGRHVGALDGILETIRATPDLAFLDLQIYPVLDGLAPTPDGAAGQDRHVPTDVAQLRSGFSVCQRMLALMEEVYHDLALESDADHPDNRGWINLFRRWWWSRMFKFTWSVTAGTHGARFQTFCERRLGYDIGPIRAGGSAPLDAAALARDGSGAALDALWHDVGSRAGLDRHERRILRAFRRAYPLGDGEQLVLVPLQVEIADHPTADDGPAFPMNVGFAVVRTGSGPEADAVVYFRIRSHLRNMGLARAAVRALLTDGRFANLRLDLDRTPDTAPDLPSAAQRASFIQMFESVRRELAA